MDGSRYDGIASYVALLAAFDSMLGERKPNARLDNEMLACVKVKTEVAARLLQSATCRHAVLICDLG